MEHYPMSEHFRQSLVTHVYNGKAALLPRLHEWQFGIQGVMHVRSPCGDTTAKVSIRFGIFDWPRKPPVVQTDVDWLQPQSGCSQADYADWHRYPDGKLCWIRPDCWAAECQDRYSAQKVERAAVILAKAVGDLLSYHYIASILHLVKWPKEWDFWPHGSFEKGLGGKKGWTGKS